MIQIRPLQTEDFSAILAIQTACYPPTLHESAITLQAKQQLAPDSCWVASLNGQVQAYLFSHPWQGLTPPALNIPLTHLPDHADHLFLHDLAVHPAARGSGLALQLLHHARRWADLQQLSRFRLIAVSGAAQFWEKQGFQALMLDPQLHRKLADYGAGAIFMESSSEDKP